MTPFWILVIWLGIASHSPCPASEPVDRNETPAIAGDISISYADDIAPILDAYCFGCHGYGAAEGDLSLDDYPSDDRRLADAATWWAVLKNLRADVMPPDGEEVPSDDEKRLLARWIKTAVFDTDPALPDPGHVALHRLNRLEYRNTIRDLMGVEFETDVEFPPDDSGDGFDNNADALSISPLLTEKYLAAASEIVARAVPQTSRVVAAFTIDPSRFGEKAKRGWSFDQPFEATCIFNVDRDASYRLIVPFEIKSSFNFNADKAVVQFVLDGRSLFEKNFAWGPNQDEVAPFEVDMKAGEHSLQVIVTPQPTKVDQEDLDVDDDDTFVRLELDAIRVEGPLAKQHWLNPEDYHRFFPRDDPPSDHDEQRRYAREILQDFCLRACRRPVEPEYVGKLLSLVGFGESSSPDSFGDRADISFEQRIARAMTAVLASPRFLFRVEQPQPGSTEPFPLIDEYSLASRLSYFLWSTMPDRELIQLADTGQLRTQLPEQIRRMMADERSSALVENFVGQWLQTRDVETVSIDPLAALGVREEYELIRDKLRSLEDGFDPPDDDASEERRNLSQRYRELRSYRGSLDQDVRADMGRQTRRLFSHVIRQNRSLLELVDADYEFLNERLADHYGIEPVDAPEDFDEDELHQVRLPDGSPFGGVLTQGTFLLVTSNPTRTSPVKRGLFILDNILGTPAPPAPAEVPELEEAAEETEREDLTLRELLERHRSEAICRSCHARFDPLGLALENFTAIGTWRDQEHGKPVDPAGRLITGETFSGVRELKSILVGPRRLDFYRCLCQRMLTYAIGRSLDYRDEVTIDQMVAELDQSGGQALKLIDGIIRSSAFQRMRADPHQPELRTQAADVSH